jgi:hypothetical protein
VQRLQRLIAHKVEVCQEELLDLQEIVTPGSVRLTKKKIALSHYRGLSRDYLQEIVNSFADDAVPSKKLAYGQRSDSEKIAFWRHRFQGEAVIMTCYEWYSALCELKDLPHSLFDLTCHL